jgi:hypothetical protein
LPRALANDPFIGKFLAQLPMGARLFEPVDQAGKKT